MYIISVKCSKWCINSQKSINDGIDGGSKFTEDGRDHVHMGVDKPGTSHHGEQEDHGVWSPGDEPDTGCHRADFKQFLFSLERNIREK